VIFKTAAAAILDIPKIRNFNDHALNGFNVHQHAKFHRNRSNGGRDMAI